MRLMVQIAGILMKLQATFKSQIIRAGRATAERVTRSLQRSGVEKYAPHVLEWFKDKRFITYLGVLATNEPRM
jgi:cobyric acid synthase